MLNILQYFDDFDQVDVVLYYEATSYNPATGKVERSYTKRGDYLMWVYQASAMQSLVSDKIIDQSDLVAIGGELIDKADVAKVGDEYYNVVSPDDILHQGEVFVAGLKRTEKPAGL